MVLCDLCGDEANPKYVGHYGEHKNIVPEKFRGAKQWKAKMIKEKADKLIPGKVNLCAWCHAALHGEQWFEGMKEAFNDRTPEEVGKKYSKVWRDR
ncbi:hypothetical protein DRO97_00020 [Archaeoglobales archaeon]|nr:MAG: hypothetical protein DRO97_00020 [Archaeoglobales archaeon]